MNDADVFGKLSRIFETHGFSRDDPDHDLEDILDELDPDEAPPPPPLSSRIMGSPAKQKKKGEYSPDERPTPYDVFEERYRKQQFIPRTTPKLSSEQWDRLVDKMHQSNRVKQSAMIREQNHGLASELGGYLFKPRINKKSLDLSSTMKSLQHRLPEMMAEKKKELDAKVKENKAQEMAGCTFKPTRNAANTSAKYLNKMGRKKLNPDDLIAYHQEKQRRIEIRKAILQEVQEKECTFRPTVSEKTSKIHEKLKEKGSIIMDPITKTMQTPPHHHSKMKLQALLAQAAQSAGNVAGTGNAAGSQGGQAAEDSSPFRLEDGPMLTIESEHPYRNNTHEFTTVAIPGAVQYTITFTAETKTEPIYDFVKFYDDDTHTHYFGAGKYSGGANNTPYNWPGLGNPVSSSADDQLDGSTVAAGSVRPPLIIPAARFIIHFHTNGSINDWGFRMQVIPTLMIHTATGKVVEGSHHGPGHHYGGGGHHTDGLSLGTPSVPMITDPARALQRGGGGGGGGGGMPVHQRLYKNAVTKQIEQQSKLVELMQNKLNITLKPWEMSRTTAGNGGGGTNLHLSMMSNTNNTAPNVPESPLAHAYVQRYNKSHIAKNTVREVMEEMVVASTSAEEEQQGQEEQGQGGAGYVVDGSLVSVVEFDDSYSMLWKQLRS